MLAYQLLVPKCPLLLWLCPRAHRNSWSHESPNRVGCHSANKIRTFGNGSFLLWPSPQHTDLVARTQLHTPLLTVHLVSNWWTLACKLPNTTRPKSSSWRLLRRIPKSDDPQQFLCFTMFDQWWVSLVSSNTAHPNFSYSEHAICLRIFSTPSS